MFKLTLQTIANILSAKVIGDSLDQITVDNISIDTRTLTAGDLFIAISGANFDGHNFANAAQRAGATAVVVSKKVDVNIPQLIVADTQAALRGLAQYQRQLFEKPLIGITGSYGKTTVKEMLAAILRESGQTLATLANQNNTIGVPLTLLGLTEQHQYAVLELGINMPGEMSTLLETTQPLTVALVTGIASAHCQGLGDLSAIAEQKGLIYQALKKDGTAVINKDCEFSKNWRQKLSAKQQVLTFSLQSSADIRPSHIKLDDEGRAYFILHTPKGDINVKNNLPGKHQVMNALAATAAAYAVGVPLSAIQKGLAKVGLVSGRLQIKQGIANCRIIDDSYNASNIQAVEVALELLTHYTGKRIFIFAGIAELGEQTQACHRKIGELIKAKSIDYLFTCGEYGHIVAQAYGSQAKHFNDHNELCQVVRSLLTHDAVVLIKGSRRYQLDKTIVPKLLAKQEENRACS